jgi:hypothetical protein
MEYMLKHRYDEVQRRACAVTWRIDHIGSEKNVPLGLREYAALTETVDIEADWIRLKHHPSLRFLSRDDVVRIIHDSSVSLEVEKHFPNTDVDDWMSMFVRLANDIPFLLDDDTDRLRFHLPSSRVTIRHEIIG